MDKAVIKHRLLEDPFSIPMRIRKKLPIEKNIFDLYESQVKQMATPGVSMQEECQISDPLIMDSTLIKSLLFGKIESYLILMSLIISCILVYKYQDYVVTDNGYNEGGKFSSSSVYEPPKLVKPSQDQGFAQVKKYLLILQTSISVLLVAATIIGYFYHKEANRARGLETKYVNKIMRLVLFIVHPNIWMDSLNFLLHLFIITRLFFLVSYWIKTSVYHNNRSFRLTDIYGIKPSENFFFAVKSIFNEMMIQEIVLMYVLIVFLFSHCLYLAGMSDDDGGKTFSSCFQIIIVTLPTIGYGEYEVTNLMQRGIILLALVVGASMNSLVTLIMLRQFQMSTQQTSSYNLLHKLYLKERMEHISREYIVTTVKQLRSSNFNTLKKSRDQRLQSDSNFKQEYKYLKSHYNQISTRDLNSMFTLFKQQLKQLRISFGQMNNLVFVLLSKLQKINSSKNERPKRE